MNLPWWRRLWFGLHISHGQLCPLWSASYPQLKQLYQLLHCLNGVGVWFHCIQELLESTISSMLFASSASTSISLSTWYHFKTMVFLCGVVSMKSRRWWHTVRNGFVLHWKSGSRWYVLWRKGWLNLGCWWSGSLYVVCEALYKWMREYHICLLVLLHVNYCSSFGTWLIVVTVWWYSNCFAWFD